MYVPSAFHLPSHLCFPQRALSSHTRGWHYSPVGTIAWCLILKLHSITQKDQLKVNTLILYFVEAPLAAIMASSFLGYIPEIHSAFSHRDQSPAQAINHNMLLWCWAGTVLMMSEDCFLLGAFSSTVGGLCEVLHRGWTFVSLTSQIRATETATFWWNDEATVLFGTFSKYIFGGPLQIVPCLFFICMSAVRSFSYCFKVSVSYQNNPLQLCPNTFTRVALQWG